MKHNLKDLFDKYLLECQYTRRLRSETIRGYKEALRNFFFVMPNITEPDQLTREITAEFFYRIQVRKRIVGKDIEKVGLKDSTIRAYWSKLNSFFMWLEQNKYLEKNPLHNTKPPEPVYDDNRALSKEEISKIISAITLKSHNRFLKKRDLMMVSILIFCGLRKNELVSLEVRDIDIDKRVLTVRGVTSKSKKSRQIPINPSLHITLEDYFDEVKRRKLTTHFLIASSTADKGISSHGLIVWVKKMKYVSGVNFHLHRFRHTFACNLARQNVSAIKLQKLLGHTDLNMTQKYLRSLTVEDMRDDVNRMSIDNLA
jgi:integrase/recombinase XerD